ncbi:MAG: DUF5050 domain-containing protein [Eubacteriales bacterium]|nr:DUF5050 domain-containing protein [Eubacteriales bacterium]
MAEYSGIHIIWFTDSSKRIIEIGDGETIWIGSASDCDIVLSEMEAVPYHLGISYDAQQQGLWLIRETEGKVYFADGELLPVGEEIFASAQEIVYIGNGRNKICFELTETERPVLKTSDSGMKKRYMTILAALLGAGCLTLIGSAALGQSKGKKSADDQSMQVSSSAEQTETELVQAVGDYSDEDIVQTYSSDTAKTEGMQTMPSSVDIETETRTGAETAEGVRQDNSTGVYRMSDIVEEDGYLYYCNALTNDERKLYRISVENGEETLFLEQDEDDWYPDHVMATDQYIYVHLWWKTGGSKLAQYSMEGEKLGEIKLKLGSEVYFSNGYIYTGTNSVYRIKVEDQAEPEQILTEDCDNGFTIVDDRIYCLNDQFQVVRYSADGSNREVLDDSAPYEEQTNFDISNVYDDKLVFEYQVGAKACVRDLKNNRTSVFAEKGENLDDISAISQYGLWGTGSTGYLIGNVFIYTKIEHVGWSGAAIWGYNLDTGEDFEIVSELPPSEGSQEITPWCIYGQTRLYYMMKEYSDETMAWERYFCSINLDGTDQKIWKADEIFRLANGS